MWYNNSNPEEQLIKSEGQWDESFEIPFTIHYSFEKKIINYIENMQITQTFNLKINGKSLCKVNGSSKIIQINWRYQSKQCEKRFIKQLNRMTIVAAVMPWLLYSAIIEWTNLIFNMNKAFSNNNRLSKKNLF